MLALRLAGAGTWDLRSVVWATLASSYGFVLRLLPRP